MDIGVVVAMVAIVVAVAVLVAADLKSPIQQNSRLAHYHKNH